MAQKVKSFDAPLLSATGALWPLGLAMALSLMGDATLYAVLPLHPADAGIALGSVGLILSVNRLVRLGTNGPAGWLFDWMPDRRVLFHVALWLGVLSTVIYTLATDLPVLFAARLLWGLSWSGIWVGGNAIVLQMAPEAQRGRWVGIYQGWFFLGSAIGSFSGGILTDALGYRTGLSIGAALSAIGALAAFAMVDHRPMRASARLPRLALSGLSAWRNIPPGLWAVAAAHGMNRLTASGVVSATLGLVIQASLGPGLQLGQWQIGVASVTGGLLAARTLVSLVGAPFAGIWSDASGRRWHLLALSLGVGGLGIGLLAVPEVWVVIIGVFLGAAASGSIQALATTLAGDLSRHHGSNLGILYTAGDLGSAIGPLVAYAVMPLGGLGIVYVICALCMLLVGIWTALLAR